MSPPSTPSSGGAGQTGDRGLPKVVLYNPEAVFWTMPLALLAIGSNLDRRRFRVVIVDGRLEPDPASRLRQELADALCLGVTVLTGAPLLDALAASRLAKRVRPDLPVIWGGWHPSLFATEVLDEPSVDVTVQGQGEATFAEVVERLVEGRDARGVPGCSLRVDGEAVRNPPRALEDVNGFAPHDFGLIDVERYFARKGQRQLDYVASTGCVFRCAFCADPFVYGRRWVGLEPERVVGELAELHARHALSEIAFQDETFFTYRHWAVGIAEGLLSRRVGVPWTATLRADQGTRLGEDAFALCVRSGLRRVMIGVESGSQQTLDWLDKDIDLEQVVSCAELCARYRVAAIFPFIVGFPGESDASVEATLSMVKRLREMSPRFETPIFYFKPYPGSKITREVVAQGHRLPSTLEEWAEFDFVGSSGPWVSAERHRLIERFKFYNRIGWGIGSSLLEPMRALARWRLRRDRYGFPWEKALADRLRPQPRLS